MTKTHELRLKIDAAAAEAGARRFTSAVATVRKAVESLDRDTTGAFTKLKNVRPEIDVAPITRARSETNKLTTSTDKAAATIQRTALASASALRTSEQAAQRLALRMGDLGNTNGIAQLEGALQRMRTSLTNATSTLDVRAAKSQFDDLRSSLLQTTVAAEYARGGQAQLARETEDAARAAATQAEQLDRLRAKYNPLYSASKQYESALEEISFAEREGALSAQMAEQARARAAQTLASASTAADQYTAALQRNGAMTQQGVMVGHQLSDVLITSQMGFQSVGMIALQQGSQLAAQMNGLKAAGGGVMRTLLSGFTSLLNPISLVTIAAVAAGAAIAKWFFYAGEETKAFKDALGDANTQISALQRSTEVLASARLGALVDGYGRVNAALQEHLEKLAKVERLRALALNSDMVGSIRSALTSDGNMFTTSVDAIRRAFDTTNDRARHFMSLMKEVQTARTFEDQLAALTKLRSEVETTTGGLDRAEGEARSMLIQLIEAEDAAIRLKAAGDESAKTIAGASDQTTGWAAAMSGVRAEIDAIGASLASIGGGVISNAGKAAELTALQKGKDIKEAAVVRVRFEKEAEFSAREMAAGDGFAGWAQRQLIDAERFQMEEGFRLDAQLEAARAKARETSRKNGGGSRKEKLSAEAKASRDLTNSIKERLAALQDEGTAMALVNEGRFESAEAARLAAEALRQNAGQIDATTAAMLRQIDAQAVANERLRNTPDLSTTAAESLEKGLQEGLSQSLQGNVSSFGTQLAQTVRASIADAMAERIVASLGIDQLFNVGSNSAALKMQSAIITGGNIAAQNMATAVATGKASASAGGGEGGFLSSALSFITGGMFSEGGYSNQAVSHASVPASAFANAPHYAEGTVNTSGIPAILHDNEAVVPLSRGRKIPVDLGGEIGGGGRAVVLNGGVNVSVEARRDGEDDAAFAQRIGESMRDQLESLITTRIFESQRYGGALNPRGGR